MATATGKLLIRRPPHPPHGTGLHEWVPPSVRPHIELDCDCRHVNALVETTPNKVEKMGILRLFRSNSKHSKGSANSRVDPETLHSAKGISRLSVQQTWF